MRKPACLSFLISCDYIKAMSLLTATTKYLTNEDRTEALISICRPHVAFTNRNFSDAIYFMIFRSWEQWNVSCDRLMLFIEP
jgi:hypothetical protein